MVKGKKVLVTGATGQVARPVAESLVASNEVWCIGRFGQPGSEQALAAAGIHTWRWDMASDPLDGLPDDFTHVMHSAAHRGDGTDFDAAVEINTVAAGRLMAHCRHAEAFLFVSSGVVYARQDPAHRHRESDALGGRMPWLPTYPVSKLAAEGAVRAFAATLGLPTTIARLNVAYGPYGHGGMPLMLLERVLAGEPIPVPRVGQNWCSPIHTDDIVVQVPELWQVAAAPARIVNWGGDEAVGVQDLVSYLGKLVGARPEFIASDVVRETNAFDNTLRRQLIGECQVPWRTGLRRTVEMRFPDRATPISAIAGVEER